MPIDRVISNIANSQFCQRVSKSVNKAAASFGEKYEKTHIKDFFESQLEPKGANNKFLTLAGFMAFCVISPRVVVALRRNPDNKEATKDEIREILFRDIQSVLVVLFMLKSLNALIAAGLSAKKGLPLTSKPYQKLFDSSLTTFSQKARDFIEHPIQKLKIIGKNALDILHPTDGVRAKVNDEYSVEYANFNWSNFPKFFESIKNRGGDTQKVCDNILDGTIKEYENILNGSQKKGKAYGINDYVRIGINAEGENAKTLEEAKNNALETIEKLRALKDKTPEEVCEIQDKAVQNAFSEYIKNPENSLVQNGKGTNALLRAAALTMEASYLGFGIPALNQRFLEHKYLSDDEVAVQKAQETDRTGASLISKNIKAHEVKLYHNFIK